MQLLTARDTFDSVYGFAIYVCWIAKNTVAISDRVTVKKTIAILQELSVIKGMVVRHNSSTKWTCSMDEHNVAGHASFTLSCRLSKRTFLLTIIPDDEKLWTVANMRASPSFRKMCYKYYYLALERAYPKVACLNKHMTSQGNPWGGGGFHATDEIYFRTEISYVKICSFSLKTWVYVKYEVSSKRYN